LLGITSFSLLHPNAPKVVQEEINIEKLV